MAQPRNSRFTQYSALQLESETETINGQTVSGYQADSSANLTHATGTAAVTPGSAGYAPGCVFVLTNALAGSPCVYLNKGTSSSANFSLVTQA